MPLRLMAVSVAVAGALAGWTCSAGAQDQDTATFEVVVNYSWSEDSAPFEFPDDGHMSGIVGITHSPRYVLFRDGQTASSGLELVAENGRPKTMLAEFDEGARRERIGTVIEGPALEKVPGSVTFTFTAGKRHALLSFVTMIAPSPDWFTGLADVALRRDGKWIDDAAYQLWAWDSGTDSGATYMAPDTDTQPQESVRLLATPHFLTDGGLVPMGSVTVRRVSGD